MKDCTQLTNQANRISGQVAGISRMIESGRDVTDIIQQISAAKSSLSKLAVELLKDESNSCFQQNSKEDKIKKFEELVTNFFKVS